MAYNVLVVYDVLEGHMALVQSVNRLLCDMCPIWSHYVSPTAFVGGQKPNCRLNFSRSWTAVPFLSVSATY